MALKRIPGRLVWIYQTKINGRTWNRSTGERDHARALIAAQKLAAQAELLRRRPETSQLFSRAIVAEIERVQADVSEAAADRSRQSLVSFLKWLGKDIDLASIDTNTLADFQRDRLVKLASSTVARDLASIRSLLKANGIDVALPKKPRKIKRTRQRPFTREELGRFFDTCEPDQATAFLFLLCTGARPAEAFPSKKSGHVALLKSELDSQTCRVKIRNAKLKPWQDETERQVLIPSDVMARVIAFSENIPDPHVFPSNSSLSKLFDRILARAGIEKIDQRGRKLTAHSLRHTYATMMQSSISVFELQRALGHSQIETTSLYVTAKAPAVVIDVAGLVAGVTSGGNTKKEPAETGS